MDYEEDGYNYTWIILFSDPENIGRLSAGELLRVQKICEYQGGEIVFSRQKISQLNLKQNIRERTNYAIKVIGSIDSYYRWIDSVTKFNQNSKLKIVDTLLLSDYNDTISCFYFALISITTWFILRPLFTLMYYSGY